MSTSVNQIVQVNISQETQAVPQASFSIPAVFGPSARQGTPIAYYTSLAGMTEAGFETTDPEYVRAREFLSQDLVPVEFGVGEYTASVEQVDTIAVNTLGGTGSVYSFHLNGTLIATTGGANQQTVLNALKAAITAAFPSNPPVAGVVSGSGGAALLTLTSSVAGVAVTYASLTTNLTKAVVTANHTIVTDLQTALDDPDGNAWYGLTICSQNAWDIEQVAAFIESQKLIFVADTVDTDVLTSSTTDVASTLKANSYDRTAIIFGEAAGDGIAAGWLGGQLPQVPGASTWKFKTISGIEPKSYTATQRQRCIGVPIAGTVGKNCNIYETVGGVDITEEGFMASGQFIDITVGIDWLVSTIQTNVYSQLVNSPKVPYTNAGIAVIENAVRQSLLQGVSNGLIDGSSAIVVTAPLVQDISTNDRANRILPDVTFSCRLAGAIHEVIVNGTVTV